MPTVIDNPTGEFFCFDLTDDAGNVDRQLHPNTDSWAYIDANGATYTFDSAVAQSWLTAHLDQAQIVFDRQSRHVLAFVRVRDFLPLGERWN